MGSSWLGFPALAGRFFTVWATREAPSFGGHHTNSWRVSCAVVSDSLQPMDYIAHQVPLFKGYSRQEYWSGLPFPSPGDLPDPGIKSRSSGLQADCLLSELPGKLRLTIYLRSVREVKLVSFKLQSQEDWLYGNTQKKLCSQKGVRQPNFFSFFFCKVRL